MEKRIGIIGCGGTGKSVLAETLASKLGIPYLASKDITGDILRRDGYDYASGQQVEKFLSTPERQQEILRRTKEQQSVPEFVTDRTAVDLAAYAILEMEGALNVQRYVEECCKLSATYTDMFMCPWRDRDITDNHRRTLDPWYQFAVHAVEVKVMGKFKLRVMELTVDELEQRVDSVMRWLDLAECARGIVLPVASKEDVSKHFTLEPEPAPA